MQAKVSSEVSLAICIYILKLKVYDTQVYDDKHCCRWKVTVYDPQWQFLNQKVLPYVHDNIILVNRAKLVLIILKIFGIMKCFFNYIMLPKCSRKFISSCSRLKT